MPTKLMNSKSFEIPGTPGFMIQARHRVRFYSENGWEFQRFGRCERDEFTVNLSDQHGRSLGFVGIHAQPSWAAALREAEIKAGVFTAEREEIEKKSLERLAVKQQRLSEQIAAGVIEICDRCGVICRKTEDGAFELCDCELDEIYAESS